MAWKDSFRLITYNADELDEFQNYINTKGIYLHKHIYDILIGVKGDCSYSQLSGVIKYDKGIRNVLYKYLAAFEEKYRALLFDYYDTTKRISNPENQRIENLELIPKSNKILSFLYDISFSKHFTLFVLKNTLYKLGLINSEENQDFNLIAKLRNKTMHHNLLMTSYHREIVKINIEIAMIEKRLEILYRYLPAGINTNFEKAINRCNNIGTKMNVPNLDILCLGVMKDGIFIKK